MKLKKINGKYHVEFKTGKGKRPRTVSTGATNEFDARAVCKEACIKEIEQAAMAGVLQGKVIQTIIHGNQKLTLLGVLDEYGKWMESVHKAPFVRKNHLDLIRACVNHGQCGEVHPSELTEQIISAFINRPGDAKASTRKVALTALRRFCRWMQDNGYIHRNPAGLAEVDFEQLTHEQKEPTTRVPFTPQEYQDLLKAADAREDTFWKFAIRIGRITALRIGDIACLEWTCISDHQLSVWQVKTNTRVDIPMSEDLFAVVLELSHDDDKYIFPWERKTYRDPDTRAQLSVQFSRLCQKAGVVGKSFHCLRHTALTSVVQNGGTMEDARQLAGHASIETTKRYVHENSPTEKL